MLHRALAHDNAVNRGEIDEDVISDDCARSRYVRRGGRRWLSAPSQSREGSRRRRSRKPNLILTQNILVHTIAQGLSVPEAFRDQESAAAASRTNRQIDLRIEKPPRADRLSPNTAMQGAHPRRASKETET
jgi:hypothetical protein